MIIVTEAAKRGFRALWLEGLAEERADGEALRLDKTGTFLNDARESRLAVYIGEPEGDDDHVEHEGHPLLYVSRKVSAAFDGCVVDLVETPEGVSFAIGPPEAY